MSELPVRKFVKVWIKKRKNRVRQDGSQRVSYTLQWLEFGQERSLGPHANLSYAREAARKKEQELNSRDQPITWAAFTKKYLETFYPGYDLTGSLRKEKAADWSKSFKTMKKEKNAIDSFTRLVQPDWRHEITAEDRERFVQKRLTEVGSALTVDAELRSMRLFCNVMEEWHHRAESSNPFAGKGKATTGTRRRRQKSREHEEKARHYSFEEIRGMLALAGKEAAAADEKTAFQKKRLRVLVYFIAYTGCRFSEAVHLEWKDIDWDRGIAWLFFKVENDLKTEGSQAPFGLPEKLLEILREWEKDKTCAWVFPNSEMKPWKSGGPGYRPFDQMKALGERAGVKDANFKRHSLSTHGKQRFGMSREQVQAQLRHTTTETQKHYDHDDLANLRAAVGRIDFEV